MTWNEAHALREAAGQPLEWPAGIHPPLSRLALTRIVATQCEKERLKTSQWDIGLYDPMGNDSGHGDDALAIVIEGVGELLQVSIVATHAPLTLGELIEEVEEAFLTQWRALVGMNLTDEQLFDMLGRAVGKSLTGDEAIAELIPEAQLAGFWQRLPEPWGSLWPTVAMKTIWWPLTERTWGVLGVWGVLTYLLWKNVDVSIGSRLVLSTIVVWLCWTFIIEQPVRPVWPKTLVTVRDVAHAMLAELREQQEHWALLERDWGHEPPKSLEGASASLP